MTTPERLGELAEARPVHSHWCDCEECWVGYSVPGPKPVGLFGKIAAALRARIAQGGDNE